MHRGLLVLKCLGTIACSHYQVPIALQFEYLTGLPSMPCLNNAQPHKTFVDAVDSGERSTVKASCVVKTNATTKVSLKQNKGHSCRATYDVQLTLIQLLMSFKTKATVS